MTDQLREALNRFDRILDDVPLTKANYEQLRRIGDAARKWLAVTESEPIQYCEVHADQIMPHLVDVDQAVRCRWGMKVDGSKDCRLVGTVALVPMEDEE